MSLFTMLRSFSYPRCRMSTAFEQTGCQHKPESPTCAHLRQCFLSFSADFSTTSGHPSSSAVVTPVQGSIYKTGGAVSKNTDESNVCFTLTPLKTAVLEQTGVQAPNTCLIACQTGCGVLGDTEASVHQAVQSLAKPPCQMLLVRTLCAF